MKKVNTVDLVGAIIVVFLILPLVGQVILALVDGRTI